VCIRTNNVTYCAGISTVIGPRGLWHTAYPDVQRVPGYHRIFYDIH